MDCRTAQDAILEALAISHQAMNRDVAAHLATCVPCAGFAARQHALDVHLASALVAPGLSPSFRPALRDRIGREKRRAWLDALPDVVHFTSCAVATAVCAVLAPANMALIAGAGVTAALSTYVALTVVRESLENAD
jgi:hypothetical protein